MTEQIDVFISYKREERSLADAVSQALQDRGYTVVTDIDIGKGEHFGAAIDRMIRAARAVVVLWTPGAAGSQWVQDEARLAIELDTYVGILLESTDLPVDIRYRQCLDLVGESLGTGVGERIADTVADRIGEPAVDTEQAEGETRRLNDELMLFQAVERNASIEAYQAFLRAFPSGTLASVAEAQIRRLSNWRTRARNWLPPLGAVGVIIGIGSLYIDYISVVGVTPERKAAASQNNDEYRTTSRRVSDGSERQQVWAIPRATAPAQHFGMALSSVGNGVLIRSVEATSTAEALGLEDGDRITTVGARSIDYVTDFDSAIASERRAGRESARLEFERDGSLRQVFLPLR